MPKLIDTHAHLQFEAFQEDVHTIIERNLNNDIWMIMPGTQKDTSERSIKIAESYPSGVYSAIGIHPLHVVDTPVEQEEISFHARGEIFDKETYRTLALSPKVVAIGECGLEYFRIQEHAQNANKDLSEIKQLQHTTYASHAELACELQKPLITHCRSSNKDSTDAYEDILNILNAFPSAFGVLHCFTSNFEVAKSFLNRGFFISFTGIITFATESYLLDAVRKIPLERILIETDAPYLTPHPHRGKRNDPAWVQLIAEKIADLKGLSFENVAEQTTKNALDLFRIQE